MTTHDNLAVAAGHSADPSRWLGMLDELMLQIGARFRRVEPQRRARAFVVGLLAGLPRKNCWTLAEHAGDITPGGMQHLLSRASWNADGVRDDVRGYVVEHLGDPGAVLVADETGDVKKGTATAGVARQYTGTAGRVENAQVAVYLTYAAPRGHALIDRELYLPQCWIRDKHRCAAAGIPGGTMFATKPALALQMIARALDAGAPAAWATGDEVYGGDPGLRTGLEERQLGYVLAVAKNHTVATAAGSLRADALAARLPPRAWQRLSAGAGAKGQRWYDWAWVVIEPGRPGYRHLLVRRNRHTRELAFYRCLSRCRAPLATLVKIAGIRWSTEENFQAGKGLTGLDEHQVRTWTSWHRWVTLAMRELLRKVGRHPGGIFPAWTRATPSTSFMTHICLATSACTPAHATRLHRKITIYCWSTGPVPGHPPAVRYRETPANLRGQVFTTAASLMAASGSCYTGVMQRILGANWRPTG